MGAKFAGGHRVKKATGVTMIQINIQMTEEQADQLAQVMVNADLSMQQVIRRAITHFLTTHELAAK